MNKFWVLVYFCMAMNLRSAAPVDYVSVEGPGTVSEAGAAEVLKALQKELPLSDHQRVNGRVVAWAVKKEDSGSPPGLLEEVVLLLRIESLSTNLWVLTYLRRDLARGAIMSEEWIPGPTGEGMVWKRTMTHEPAESEMASFLRQSNFGNSEYSQGLIPLRVTVYAPFKSLRRVAVKGISNSEREKRFRGLDDIIWDPFPLR